VFDLSRIKEVDEGEASEDVCGRVEDGSSVHYYALGIVTFARKSISTGHAFL
jgi:hypothetical protein